MQIAQNDFLHLEKVFEVAEKKLMYLGGDDIQTGGSPEYIDSDDDGVSTTAAGSTVGAASTAGWSAASTVSPSPCR